MKTLPKNYKGQTFFKMLVFWFVSFLAAYLVSDIYYQSYKGGEASEPYIEMKNIVAGAWRPSLSHFTDFPTFFTTCHNPLHIKDLCDQPTQLEDNQSVVSAKETKEHPQPPRDQTYFQILNVILISLLWFRCFIATGHYSLWRETSAKKERRRDKFKRWFESKFIRTTLICLSLLPAMIFMLSMTEAYQPAVFVMAMVAIFVAAEHYGGLQETEKKLDEDVDKLTDKLETLLNADGLEAWKETLYEDYRKAENRIDAIIRHFDIDESWWKLDKDPWSAYIKASRKKKSNTLLYALGSGSSTASVQFVSDIDIPTFNADPDEQLHYFRALLGLAWQLVVLFEARNMRDDRSPPDDKAKEKYLRIKIAPAPFWMHVVDNQVNQIIERVPINQSTVRKLSSDSDTTDEKHPLRDWTRRNIRRTAHRGGLGEEYVCSALSLAAIHNKIPDYAELSGDTLTLLLNSLGMNVYLNSGLDFRINNDDKTKTSTECREQRLCKAIFSRFLENYCKTGIALEGRGSTAHRRVSDLFKETL
ncbi:MAG TPA: hypothetical protein VGC62_16070 [Pseudomonas sp.]|uniref:hypothetical protein n=1 Tax=Pseudomonas sp. TaxID=306 RepID=UPI002ED969BC